MNLLWRDTGRPLRFLGVDGRAASGILVVLLHLSITTLAIAVMIMVIFATLERFDYTVPNAMRKARSMVAGKRRIAVHAFRRKKYRSS